MNNWNFSLQEWEKEKLDELVRQESERVDREEREEEIQKGIKKGVEQNTKDIIKNMLLNDFDLKAISKISGKTVEEIKQIKQNLKM